MTKDRRNQRAPGGVVAELGPLATPIVRQPIAPPDENEEGWGPLRVVPSHLGTERDDGLPRLTIMGDPLSGGPVNVYHRVVDPASPRERWCWAFTISRESAESLVNDGPLLAAGATYPDGRPCVSPGVAPWDVEVHCGTCRRRGLEHVELRLIGR